MRAVIIDDEFMPAEFLEELIKKHCPEVYIEEVFTDSEEALTFLQNNEVDTIFLDIEMPGLSGLELIELLPKEKLPQIVFTTAYNQYALKAFELSAVHYLLKPVDPEMLKEAVSRVVLKKEDVSSKVLKALELLNMGTDTQSEKLSLPEGQMYHLVDQEEIIKIEGAGSYSTFYLKDGRKIMVSKRIKLYEEKLNKNLFIRTHQSHIVNKNYIARYNRGEGGYIELSDGSQVPISTGLKSTVKEQLGI